MVINWYYRILITLYDIYNFDYRNGALFQIRERTYKIVASKTIYKIVSWTKIAVRLS